MALDTSWQSVDEVIVGLAGLEQQFRQARDRRAVFLTVYVMMSQEMGRRIQARQFLDNDWVARYTVSFGNLYRRALAAFERGETVPKAWTISFQNSAAGTGLVIQDLLLGINAHINHDLALALHEVSIDPDRESRYQDHTSVNQVLSAIGKSVEDRICAMYAPGLEALSACAGGAERLAANFSIDAARQVAWDWAVHMAGARADEEPAMFVRLLDIESEALAKLLLAPDCDPPLLDALRNVEQGTAWWETIRVEQQNQIAV
jgi:hypothetical protein